MIDHQTARRLAATAIDFPLDADERAVHDLHVRSCSACRAREADLRRDAAMLSDLDLGPVPISVRAHVAIAAEAPGGGLSPRWVMLAAAAILLIAVVGAGIFAGAGATGPGRIGRSVHWTTPVVDLVAQDLWIEAAGRRFVPPQDGQLEVDSDPGDATRWTLEVTWFDGDVEMRIYLYFASDGERWQITETRTYDGRSAGDWIEIESTRRRGAAGHRVRRRRRGRARRPIWPEPGSRPPRGAWPASLDEPAWRARRRRDERADPRPRVRTPVVERRSRALTDHLAILASC